MSEYKIPAEVLEQASLGLSDLADMIRKIAADAFRAGQAAAGREIERRYCSRAIADEIHEEAVSLLIEVARDYAAERSR